MDENKFLMWRACFAILKLDGQVSDEEKTWAENLIFDQSFSPEQERQLQNDLYGQDQFDAIFDQITSPADKSYVLHMVRTLGNIDGHYSESEKAAFKRVQDKINASIDIADIKKKADEMVEKRTTLEELAVWLKNLTS
jgi:hypothetical protein